MIDSDVRTVQVGSIDAKVWITITDKRGEDITALTPDLRWVPPGEPASGWETPTSPERPTPSMVRCLLEVTPTIDDVGWWRVEARIDGEIIDAGGFRVVA